MGQVVRKVMSSIFANKFETNRISRWKDDLVVLEDHEVRNYRLEDQLHREKMYWEENVQGKSVRKEEKKDLGAKLQVQG